MRILVDADACPVKQIIEEVAGEFEIELLFVVNPHHHIESRHGSIVLVDGGSQAVDLALANMAGSGDIVVTQDYGLASMIIARRGMAIHPDGWLYRPERIDALLMQRHLNAKARKAGFRTAHARRRAAKDNEYFRNKLRRLIEAHVSGQNLFDE